MKRKLLPVLSVLILILAAGAALYPTLSSYLNNLLAKGEIAQYNNTVDALSAEDKSRCLRQAEVYNDSIRDFVKDSFSPTSFIDDTEYLATLNLTDNGQMGTIDIPCIDCHLPIYHDSDDMLSKGAIHMAGTSLPIGGESNHAVISAHTAYPGKILFDKLTDVQIGDTFSVTVLGDTMHYKVFDTKIVLPDEVSYLNIERGRDLVTLITCTPYSINTHRLLVTGERYYPADVEEEQTAVVTEKDSMPLYITIAALVVIVALIILYKGRKRRHEK